MTKKKTGKMTATSNLTKSIPVRLYEADGDKLKKYEERGLINMSDIIRRCVNKALPDVLRELREELERIESES